MPKTSSRPEGQSLSLLFYLICSLSSVLCMHADQCSVDYYYSSISCAPTLSPFRAPPTVYYSHSSFLSQSNSLSCSSSQPPHLQSLPDPHPLLQPSLTHLPSYTHSPLPLYPLRGKRRLQLEHIKEELRYPWLDLRKSIGPPSESEMFTTITGTYMCVCTCVCVGVGVRAYGVLTFA
jgi:hypothetical protein